MRSSPLLGLALLAGCVDAERPSATADPWFEEVAAEAGLVFHHDSGHREGRHLFPEIACGGAALFDMDGDGDLDAYLVQAGQVAAPPARRPPNRLFRNAGDGTFEDVTTGSGADDRGYGMGVASGDYDGDGRVDLFVTNLARDTLLRNEGGGRFTDVTVAAGLDAPGWSTSAAFVDYDGDGDLDLFVTRYVLWSPASERACFTDGGVPDYCGPNSYAAPAPDVLYRNDGGRFTDVSAAAGLHAAYGNGLGVVCADFDGDARPDVYVANDGMVNQLWINGGDGTFTDRGLETGCGLDDDGVAKAGMGVAAADVDDDGDPDLLVVNLTGESDSYYRNEDGAFFVDVTRRAGLAAVTRPYTRFGTGLVDLDNDGRLDLFTANGRVRLQATTHGPDPYAEPDLALRGLPGGRFAPVLLTARPRPATSRAAAFGDVDLDGRVDVLVVNRDGPAHLYRNVTDPSRRWIAFDVREDGRPALGARLEVGIGDRTVYRTVRTASSYLAASDPRVHVGLGGASGVDDVVVRWPDGSRTRHGGFAADRVVRLQRPRDGNLRKRDR